MSRVPDIIASVLQGKNYCEQFKKNYFEDSSMYIVFLFSKEYEFNRDTLYYLPLLKAEKRISKFIVVSPYEEVEKICEKYAEVSYKFVLCDKSIVHDISLFYLEFPRTARDRIILNGSHEKRDERYLQLIGCKGISTKDIVPRSVFRYQYTPEESEIRNALAKPSFFYKKINWEYVSNNFISKAKADIKFPDNVEMELVKLLDDRKLKKKDKIIIFSVTKTTRYILKRLKDYEVIAILDNNPVFAGTEVEGIPVYTPAEFLQKPRCEDYKIIVPTRSYQLICEQLLYFGYEIGKQVFITYQERLRDNEVNSNSDDEMRSYILKVSEGEKIYDRIRKQYKDCKIYVCPYPGTGDLYLVGMYLKERLKYDGEKECVIVVTSQSCNKVLSLFDLKSVLRGTIVLKNQEEAEQLLAFSRGIGTENANVDLLNNDGGLIDLGYMSGCKGLDFNTLFQKVVFFSQRRYTQADIKKQNADDIFERNSLRKGKTVLLSPYVNTVDGISEETWIQIAKQLKSKGYDVCTNISGNSESPIEGTKGIFIPYVQIVDFLNKAGGFIGFRSGLCDIISGTKALKVILYPLNVKYCDSSFYDYFSLRHMGLATENILEFEIGDENTEDIMEEVIRCVP